MYTVICFFTETAEFCSVNSTSPDPSSLTSGDYLMIRCRFSYHAPAHWTPHVHCLPNTDRQTTLINNPPGTVTYTKSFSATPDINGTVINCTAKFNSTGYEPRFKQADNAPDDVQLWTSALLRVQCKQFLSAEIFCD